MAASGRRSKAQIERDTSLAEEKASKIDQLAEFGLEHRQEVRFRRPGKKNWTPAKALLVNDDGSITILYHGRLGAVFADGLEKKEVGPRGGTKWTPVTEGD